MSVSPSHGKPTRRAMLAFLAATAAGPALARVTTPEIPRRGDESAASLPSHAEIPPRDIAPDIAFAIEAIERRADILPAGETLFVPVGETHTHPAHVAFLKGLVTGLQDRGHAIALGIESSYRVILDELDANENLTPAKEGAAAGATGPASLHALLRCDRDGALSLSAFLHARITDSVFSNKLLAQTCLTRRISTRFNDLPDIEADADAGNYRIDKAETMYRRLGHAEIGDAPIDATGWIGLGLRNAAMICNAGHHAADAGARIYLQNCGSTHLFGAIGDAPYDTSLAGLWRAAGKAVFPVMLAEGADATMPNAIASDLIASGQAMMVHRLPDRSFDYEGLDADARERLVLAERDYLRAMRIATTPAPDLPAAARAFADTATRPERCTGSSRLADLLFGPAP